MSRRILVLAAHPDDAEFSCGGSLRRWADEGDQLWYAAFSPCNKSLPEGFEAGTLMHEMKKACAHLGVDSGNILQYDFPVRELPKFRQEILEEMIVLRRDIEPDLVLIPSSNDWHQDHQQVCLEGRRAFKFSSILGYELPWNNFNPRHDMHVRLEEQHLRTKWNAIKEYRTQAGRPYADKEMIYGLARVRGTQCGSKFAEAFEVIRWIL